MSRKQKLLLIALIVLVATVAGRLFLNSPIAHIQLAAETVGEQIFGKWNITNSIIAGWFAMVVIVMIAVAATRRMQLVPRGVQNLVEALIASILGIMENVAGHKNARRFFPLIATIFIFILVANWMALLPFFGNVGKVETAEHVLVQKLEVVVDDLNDNLPAGQPKYHLEFAGGEGHGELPLKPPLAVLARLQTKVGHDRLVIFDGRSGGSFFSIPLGYGKPKEMRMGEYWDFGAWQPREGVVVSGEESVDLTGKTVGRLVPYFRSMNTDLMSTLAFAIIAMFMVEYWGIRANGFFNYASRFINFKQGPLGLFLGILEIIGEFARIISFSFRLLGNMFAGEILLFSILFLLPIMAGVVIFPFVLELFVGFIQAVVFAALTLVFAVLAVTSHGADHGHHADAPGRQA